MSNLSFGDFFSTPIGLTMLVCFALIFLWITVLTYFVLQSRKFTTSLFGDTRKSELKEILQEHINRVGMVQVRLKDVEKMVSDVEMSSQRHLSKMGVVRFNPFDDTGGDQSFVLALLDERNDGVVISSLHGRQRTRMYAKPVKAGEAADYELSEEEKEAIRKARTLGYK